MKTKKALTCLITVAVLIASLSAASLTVSATQQGTATFSVGDLTAKAGDSFVAELTLKGTNIAAFQGILLYDRDALTLEKVEKTSVLKGLTVFDIKDSVYQNGSFLYAHAQGINMDEPVLKFTFKVDSGAKNGTYPFNIVNTKAFDPSQNVLRTTVSSSGAVTVSGGGNQKGSPGKVPPNPNPVTQNSTSTPASDPNSQSQSGNPNNSDNPESTGPAASDVPSGADGTSSQTTSIVLDIPGENNVPTSSPDAAGSGGSILLYVLIGLGVLVVAGIVVVIAVTRKKNRMIH